MSYSYDKYESRQRRQGYGSSSRRTTLGYWIPLALTVTVATVGIAAWIWSERKDHEEDDYSRRGGDRPPPPFSDGGSGQPPYTRGTDSSRVEEESVITRMSGALRRTPSPQQFFDGASRRVAAGMAAAGAAVGGALSSIREEDKRDYEDHSRWSEEATMRLDDSKSTAGPSLREAPAGGPITSHTQGAPILPRTNDRRKVVAIVVSAERFHLHGQHNEEETAYLQEHASILSHLPEHLDADSRLFVLIYAPELQHHPLALKSQPTQPPASLTSSYSNIGPEDIHTPSDEHQRPLSAMEPRPIQSPPRSDMFHALHTQARALVEKETMIMPFTTSTGYVHLLRHIAPEIVYVQETLAGPGGDAIFHIAGWVGQVVLVVGDESGHGGLVDSEDERGALGHEIREKWWQNHPRIGLGKGVEVVDGLRVGEDWRRRVRGYD